MVKTTNVRALTLGPILGRSRADVQIAGQRMADVDLSRRQSFQLADARDLEPGHWKPGNPNGERQKRHGCSGPIGDLFFDNVMLVSGSAGTEEENYFTRMAAYNLRSQFRKTNGGLHRGGIQGENSVVLPHSLDTELSEEWIRANNLLLFGTPATNRLLKRFEDRLPVEFGSGSIKIGERTFRGEQVAIFAVFPHPENEDRYVAVHGGVTPDATTFGSHLNVLLLPDYLVYDGPEVSGLGLLR